MLSGRWCAACPQSSDGPVTGNRVFVGCHGPRRLLHQMKLLDVPGNGGLSGGHPPLLQLGEKLLLGLDVFLAMMSGSWIGGFSSSNLPAAFFCAKTSQKLFSDRCASRTVIPDFGGSGQYRWNAEGTPDSHPQTGISACGHCARKRPSGCGPERERKRKSAYCGCRWVSESGSEPPAPPPGPRRRVNKLWSRWALQ